MRGSLRSIAARVERMAAGVQAGCTIDHRQYRIFVGDEPELEQLLAGWPAEDQSRTCACGARLDFVSIVCESHS